MIHLGVGGFMLNGEDAFFVISARHGAKKQETGKTECLRARHAKTRMQPYEDYLA